MNDKVIDVLLICLVLMSLTLFSNPVISQINNGAHIYQFGHVYAE